VGSTSKALTDISYGYGAPHPDPVSFESDTSSRKVLSDMELVCLYLHSDGYDFRYIAERLSYSENTARIILDNARKKLNASNFSQATRIAIKLGLIAP